MSPRPVLDHFAFCPNCAGPNIAKELDIRVRCPDCDFTLYFNPTSSAAVIIEDGAGRILAIRRARDPAKGKLAIPGGFLDLNETLEAAALRETKEEVNIELNAVEFLGAWPNEYTHKGISYPVNDCYFVGRAESFVSLRLEDSEVNAAELVDPREVVPSEWAFDSLRNAIRRYLERYS